MKWQVKRCTEWWVFAPGALCSSTHFLTWREAFDYAYTQATNDAQKAMQG